MISVIIPIYNREKNLDRVLMALTEQTNKDFEVVIYDDGSTDSWCNVVHKYSDKLKIRTGRQDREGNRVSRARNKGVEMANSDLGYLFVDSDVVLNKKAIENYHKLIKRFPNTVILGKYDWLRENKTIIKDSRNLKNNNALKNIGGLALSGNIYVPKDVFKRSGGFDEKVVWGGEDCVFGFDLDRIGAKAIFSRDVEGYHLWHPPIKRDEQRTINYIHNVKFPMNKISIIIPFYNRRENINLVLKSLILQTVRSFEVVLFNDGSTDNPSEVIDKYKGVLDIKVGYQENKGYRVSRARNLGCKIATTELGYLFLDSDVVLNRKAIGEYYRLIDKFNNTKVICGEYRWLPPMEIAERDIIGWNKLEEMKLPRKEVDWYVLPEEKEGKTFRPFLKEGELIPQLHGAALSGNLYVPKKAFEDTGGFDEKMEWHGQDSEFGLTLQEKGWQGVYSTRVYGLHICHERDQKKNAEDVLKAIDYIHNVKHVKSVGKISEKELDEIRYKLTGIRTYGQAQPNKPSRLKRPKD